MANEAENNSSSKKVQKARSTNDLEMLKMIIDSNPDLKRKVMRFMQKNYSKIVEKNSK